MARLAHLPWIMIMNSATREESMALVADIDRRLPPTHVLKQKIRDIYERVDAGMWIFLIVVIGILSCLLVVS